MITITITGETPEEAMRAMFDLSGFVHTLQQPEVKPEPVQAGEPAAPAAPAAPAPEPAKPASKSYSLEEARALFTQLLRDNRDRRDAIKALLTNSFGAGSFSEVDPGRYEELLTAVREVCAGA